MIEQASTEVEQLGDNAADMHKASENAMSILAELEKSIKRQWKLFIL